MANHDGSHNLKAAKAFFLALEQHDPKTLTPLLASGVVEIVPFSNTGNPEPFSLFTGKEAVLGYLVGGIMKNFSRTVLAQKQFYVADDGGAVFVEAKGDLINRETLAPYNNVYIFKFLFKDGEIIHISEYANPIAYAKMAGLPLG